MTIGHLFRLYESRSGKFIGEYDTREEAEAVAADAAPKTVINDVRYTIEDYPPYNSRPAPLLKHPIDSDAPRDPTFYSTTPDFTNGSSATQCGYLLARFS